MVYNHIETYALCLHSFVDISKTVEDVLRSRYPAYVAKFAATSCRAPMADAWFTRFSIVITTSFTIISVIRFVMNKILALIMQLEKVRYAPIDRVP